MKSSSLRARALRRIVVAALSVALLTGALPLTASAEPTQAPTPLGPLEGVSTNTNPLFTWTSVPGAAKYRIQIASNPNFTGGVTQDTYNTTYAPPKDLDVGTLYWHVAATDLGGNAGPYSQEMSFNKTASDAPVVKTPADDAILTYPEEPVVFSWDPAPGAQKYRLHIDDAEDFIGAKEVTTVNTSFTLTDPQTVGQSFFWRVQGVSKDGINTEWSQPRNYSIEWAGSPTLLSPANTQAVDVEDVVLKWEPVAGASSYHLQISPNIEFSNNLTIEEKDLRATRYSPQATRSLNNGDYYWRVRAKDSLATANFGPWSEIRTFHRAWNDQPQLLLPIDNNNSLKDLHFTWSPVEHAGYYELQMSTDANFSPTNEPPRSCYTNHTSWTPHQMFSTNGTHVTPGTCSIDNPSDPWPIMGQRMYWRVRGIDAGSGGTPISGIWSGTRSFIYELSAPEMISPLGGEVTPTPVLQWEPVRDAVFYKVTILNKTGSPMSFTTAATSYIPTTDLPPTGGPYRWYVQAIDAGERAGYMPDETQQGSFQTVKQCAVGCVQPFEVFNSPEPLTPGPGAIASVPPAMTWQPVEGAAYYKVFYGAEGQTAATTLSGSNLPFNGYTHPDNMSPGDYYWFVRAYSSTNTLLATGTQSTFTIDGFGLTEYVGPADCVDTANCAPLADTPTLDWNGVQGANYYLVHLSRDAAFTNVAKVYMTENTILSPRESLLDSQAGPYYWFVQPCRAIDVRAKKFICGQFNNSVFPSAWAFKKESAPIQLQAPTDGASVANQITFDWKDFLATNQSLLNPVTQEAKLYKIQVSTVADFATILDEEIVDQTTFTPFDTVYPEGPLYWRVIAIDGSNNELTRSGTRMVTKASPKLQLTYPANEAKVSGVPHFSWEAQPFQKKYEVEVYKNGDMNFASSNLVVSQKTKVSAWSPTTALAAGDYAWRVRRVDSKAATADDEQRPGPWSDPRVFTLNPSAPALVAPEDALLSTDDDILFDWSGVTGASHYRFELSTSPTFSSPTAQDTVMSEWAPTAKVADATYYWRVRPVDGGGNLGPASPTRKWTKDMTAPETALNVMPIGTVTTTKATFNFNSNDQTANYKCSLDGSAWTPCDSPKSYSNLSQGDHEFKVRAVDGAGNVDQTPEVAVWTVSTVNALKIVHKASSLNGEWVQFVNTSPTPITMTGWKVAVSKKLTYTFPTYTLPGKGKVKIHTGKGTNTKTDLYWGRTAQAWNDTTGSFSLLRKDGSIADTCSYSSSYTTSSAC